MASFFLVLKKYGLGETFHYYIPVIMVLISFLMVSSMHYPALSAVKFWKKKPFFYLGIFTTGMGMLFFFTELFLFVITFGYILFGFYEQLTEWKVSRRFISLFHRHAQVEKIEDYAHPAEDSKKNE
jgi:phosphatidylserine synthase